MSFTDTIFEILEEQLALKTTRTKPIVDAIKNRKKITFYFLEDFPFTKELISY